MLNFASRGIVILELSCLILGCSNSISTGFNKKTDQNISELVRYVTYIYKALHSYQCHCFFILCCYVVYNISNKRWRDRTIGTFILLYLWLASVVIFSSEPSYSYCGSSENSHFCCLPIRIRVRRLLAELWEQSCSPTWASKIYCQ